MGWVPTPKGDGQVVSPQQLSNVFYGALQCSSRALTTPLLTKAQLCDSVFHTEDFIDTHSLKAITETYSAGVKGGPVTVYL